MPLSMTLVDHSFGTPSMIGAGREMIEWRGRDMGFVMGLLVRYVIFTVATFMVGGIMGYFLTVIPAGLR